MDKNQLRYTLEQLALPQNAFAELLGVTPRAVSLWLTGERAVPNPAISYLRLFSLLTPNLRQVELSILMNEDKKMREGMYGITFESNDGVGEGMLIFENGQIYGADSGAVKYDGVYTYDPNSEIADATLKITFPPNVESVFGLSNPYEWSFDLSAQFNPNANSGTIAVRTSLGVNIAAKFVYLRALPMAA